MSRRITTGSTHPPFETGFGPTNSAFNDFPSDWESDSDGEDLVPLVHSSPGRTPRPYHPKTGVETDSEDDADDEDMAPSSPLRRFHMHAADDSGEE
ncbi:hypothetical protein MKEN_01465200 [Mycena kentingensis (nom. inval.)]|nr:hypothetical protein MKEN_01465200 [Mycena kentingensis (nom. inval.)]